MSGVLTDLWHLQETDSEIERLKKQFATLDDGTNLRGQFEKWTQERTALRSELEKTRADLTDSELRLGSLEEKKAAVERQLYGGQTTNPREVVDLQRELASIAEVRDRLETKVLQLMDAVEQLQAQMSEKSRQVELGERQLAQVEGNYASESESRKSQLEQRTMERERLAQGLGQALLERYERIKRSAGGKGASLIARGACSECRMQVPAYVLREVREGGAVVTCEHCGRLLCAVEGT